GRLGAWDYAPGEEKAGVLLNARDNGAISEDDYESMVKGGAGVGLTGMLLIAPGPEDAALTVFMVSKVGNWATKVIKESLAKLRKGSGLAKTVSNKIDIAVAQYNKNDLHHLFGRGGEIPTSLLDKFGSPEAALKALQT
ncbi:MAG: hypothetical protein VW580_03415, partial [Flavobacteriaceae bacterium]